MYGRENDSNDETTLMKAGFKLKDERGIHISTARV